MIRTPWQPDFPDTIIDRSLGDATTHSDYTAAKAGNTAAALRLAQDLVSDAGMVKVRALAGDKTAVLLPVLAEESTGRNKIPLAIAEVIGCRLGWQVATDVVQITRVSRTGSKGWHRLAYPPQFDGNIDPSCRYVLIDDTQTQGGTFAALKGHIEYQGGSVIGAYALTGKQYSVQLRLNSDTLNQLRQQHGDLENWWRTRFGYGFDALTEWEARFILNARTTTETVRNRIIAAGNG
ncbi:phosphoribosyltransferase [Conchiformibius steedae]|uniref:phosphoribosyltransferase n=1 Tax=Conchiformibius steedae TaxID=153493 RepID=UPI0026EAD7A0|nr:hypothetical protein [Conchiformibius steedae]